MTLNRLQSLEKTILTEAAETPAIVYEMKRQVESFREKLEVWTLKHCIWDVWGNLMDSIYS